MATCESFQSLNDQIFSKFVKAARDCGYTEYADKIEEVEDEKLRELPSLQR
jgi:hypothetical protein